MKLLFLILSFSSFVGAQGDAPTEKTPEPEKLKAKSTWKKIKEKSGDALEKTYEVVGKANEQVALISDYRAQRKWVVTGNYAYLDLLVPSKYGLTVGYVKDADTTYELDYMRGSWGFNWLHLNVGSVTEQRLSLLRRSYNGRNTFNYQMGINYDQFDIELGDWMLSKVTGSKADYQLMQVQTLGVSWGIGNRWQTKGGFVWAVDWLQVHMPIVTLRQHKPFVNATSDEDDREDAEKAVKFVRYFPRLVAIKLQIGLAF